MNLLGDFSEFRFHHSPLQAFKQVKNRIIRIIIRFDSKTNHKIVVHRFRCASHSIIRPLDRVQFFVVFSGVRAANVLI